MRAVRWFVLCPIASMVLSLALNACWLRAEDKPPKPAGEATAVDPKSDEYYELMKLFVDTFEQIERNYVKDVDRKQLMQAAIRGMVQQLDPYSSYYSQEEFKRLNQEIEQEFGGIGIQVQIDPKTKRLMVMTPLP